MVVPQSIITTYECTLSVNSESKIILLSDPKSSNTFKVSKAHHEVCLTLQYTFRMNALKSTSFSYVQNMVENMILRSYLDQSYLMAT